MRQYSTAGVRILEDITCDVIPRDAALDAFDIVAGRILAQSRTASFGSWSRSRGLADEERRCLSHRTSA